MRLIKRLEQSHLEFSLNMSHTICTDGRTEQGVINQWDMLQHRPTSTVYKDRGKACLKNDLNQNVLTHALCMRFTAASCLDGEETWLKLYSLSFTCQNQMCIKGWGVSKQVVFIFRDHRFCLLRELKQRRHGRGRQAEMTEDCDPALSRMCPLSERERDRQRDRGRAFGLQQMY